MTEISTDVEAHASGENINLLNHMGAAARPGRRFDIHATAGGIGDGVYEFVSPTRAFIRVSISVLGITYFASVLLEGGKASIQAFKDREQTKPDGDAHPGEYWLYNGRLWVDCKELRKFYVDRSSGTPAYTDVQWQSALGPKAWFVPR